MDPGPRLPTLICLAALAAFSSCTRPPTAPGHDPLQLPAEDRRLLDTLQEYHHSWNPRARKALVTALRADSDWIDAPLSRLLARPDHPMLEQAVELTGRLERPGLRPQLVHLVHRGPDSVRGSALSSAHRLAPWSKEDFDEFLASKHQNVVLAALRHGGKTLSVERLLDLLAHVDASVRRAAADALPASPGSEQLIQIVALATEGVGVASTLATRALARIRANIPQAPLLEMLSDPDEDLRLAALDTLTARGQPLSNAEVVWERATDSGASPRERSRAYLCLERTRSFTVENVKRALNETPPILQYYAARCLILAGDREGLATLVDLLQSRHLKGRPGEPQHAVWSGVRQMLGTFSGTGVAGSAEQWRSWLDEQSNWSPPAVLPTAVLL